MFATPINRLRQRISAKAEAWAERRQGLDPRSVELERRRVYILPTQQGVVFAALLFAMLLGSLNYANSMGFVLTVTLASLGFVAMHHTHRNLVGLVVRANPTRPVFAGSEARFTIQFANDAKADRSSIRLEYRKHAHGETDVPSGETRRLDIVVPTGQRGWLQLHRYGVSTTFPFGLFRAWAWLRMEQRCLVYPHPAPRGKTPPPVPSDYGHSLPDARGQDDFSGLRGYRAGDAPRHVAWKASARLQNDLLVKEFEGGGATTRWLDWDALDNEPDIEKRIGLLTRWVIDAEENGDRYGLRLPGETIPQGHGESHYHACLKALALLEVQ
ncbi:MAG: DUF58 domain-containing protein [Gammaproteobacteria bacterium]|nr:DUF58 domain-containing protein [Gammaproteobacteria bacterium]